MAGTPYSNDNYGRHARHVSGRAQAQNPYARQPQASRDAQGPSASSPSLQNPYAQQPQAARSPQRNSYTQRPRASQQNPYAQQPQAAGSPQSNLYTQQPRTYASPQRTPVPSPPQQNPYIPKGASSQPVLRRKHAKGRVATPVTRGDYESAYLDEAPQQQRGRRGAGRAPRPPRERKCATHGGVAFLMWLVMLVALALMAIRLLPASAANGRIVPEVVSFIPLALIPSAVFLVLSLLWRRRLLAVVCLFALVVNGSWHLGYFTGSARVSTEAASTAITTTSTTDNVARVMTLNTNHGAASAKQIVELCRSQHVEVLCLEELTDTMVNDLEAAGIDELLPYHVVSEEATAISNGGKNGIWTATEQADVSRNLLPIQTSSMPAVSITVGSRTVRFVAVHPNSPVRGAQDLWDEGLSTIGSLSDYDHAYVIMGDFNSTWDHARFRELLGTTFADASEESGQGFHMTYPSGLLPSLIEIDHIVYSKDSGITVSSLDTVNISGTDHKALLGTLEAS